MSAEFCNDIAPIQYKGKASTDPLSFRFYDKDKILLGKRLEEHLAQFLLGWQRYIRAWAR